MIDFGLFPAITLALALSWASGINVYAVLLMLGFGSMTGLIDLPSSLDFTTYPVVIILSLIFFIIEFIIDKIPFLDSAWDAPHTFIRIILGGFLASKVMGYIDPSFIIMAAFLGAFIAGSSHTMKAGTRVVTNTSPEPFSNIALSLIEDLLVIGSIYLAIKFPIFFLIIFIAYILLAIWLLPKIWHGVKSTFGFLKNTFYSNAPKKEPAQQNKKIYIDNKNNVQTNGTILDNSNNQPPSSHL